MALKTTKQDRTRNSRKRLAQTKIETALISEQTAGNLRKRPEKQSVSGVFCPVLELLLNKGIDYELYTC